MLKTRCMCLLSFKRRVHDVAKVGFGLEVSNYEKARPSYPTEALKLAEEVFELNQSPNIRVLDLAAGTGKFTRLLATNKNLEISAVEPNEPMRKTFAKFLTKIPILDGKSTSIPFVDNTFQVVFVAQAFHWFSNNESLVEIHRVLDKSKKNTHKVGLGLVWNMEDRDEEPLIGELRDLYEKYDEGIPQYRKNKWQHVFQEQNLFNKNLQTKLFKISTYLPVELIWYRILSKSYVAIQPESEREALKKRVDIVLEKYENNFIKLPQFNNKLCAHFPYYTEFTWTLIQ